VANDDPVRTIEHWIAKFEEAIRKCERRILPTKEARQLDEDMKKALRSALIKDSAAFHMFNSSIETVPLWISAAPYVQPRDCSELGRRVVALREVADQLAPEAFAELAKANKKQYHVGAGEYGRGLRLVYDMMNRATRNLMIVDAYADEKLSHLIESLENDVNIRILGRKPKPAVIAIWKAYRQQGIDVEARSGTTIHDRYLIIDGDEVWSLGASINGCGAKAHTISQIVDKDEREKLLKEFDDAWQTATTV